MQKRVITVSELNEYIKMLLENDELLCRVCVKGEISNFTNHYKTGHFYFSLKDEGGACKAVMFRSAAMKVKFTPENGMKVLVTGRVGVFPRDGQYQIYVDSMEPEGAGALAIAYEQLKAKLQKEGLFDESRKQKLPKMPMRIGVVTSPTGAAIQDILNILGRRFPLAKVTLYPALVQGESAAADVARGIAYFNRAGNVDVLIVGRGGGSIEDLWAFNEEVTVRAVAASKIPIISAVGHETDFTLCDFAADMRAPTPSAAAELAVPNAEDLAYTLETVRLRFVNNLKQKISVYDEKLKRLATSRVLTNPMTVIDDKKMALANEERILYDKTEALIREKKLTFQMEQRMLFEKMTALLQKKEATFATETAKLNALNPLSVVARGYSAVFTENHTVIKSVDDVKEGDAVSFMLTDGTVHANVTRKEKRKDEELS